MIDLQRSIDIEDEVRIALKDHMTIYCPPLPKDFSLPCLEVTQVGGTDQDGQIDAFEVTLDARAKSAAEASEYLRNGIGLLRKVAKDQTTAIRHVSVNTSGGWGSDPVRPELKMFSARLRVWAHQETTNI